MRSAIAFAVAAAAAALVEPQPRQTCPAPADYFANAGGYYGIAISYKQKQSVSFWTGVDVASSTLVTTNLQPGDPKSLYNKISPRDASFGYSPQFGEYYNQDYGSPQDAAPANTSQPISLSIPKYTAGVTFSTWKVIAQDCKLWAVINGTATVNSDYTITYNGIKGNTSDIWQFAANQNTNAPVLYQGPGSSQANAALELKIIPVSNPVPSPPPRNSTRCLTPDDYWNGNQSNWQFGFTRKHESNWNWLAMDENEAPGTMDDFYWYGAGKTRPNPLAAGGVVINKTTKYLTSLDYNVGPGYPPFIIYTTTIGLNPDQIQVSSPLQGKNKPLRAKANLVELNCNLYVVKPGTENGSLWQWAVDESKYKNVGSYPPYHPAGYAVMWVVPIEQPQST